MSLTLPIAIMWSYSHLSYFIHVKISFIWSFSSKCKLIHVDKLHSNLHPSSGFHLRVNNYVLQIQMCSISSMCVRVSWVHMEKFHHWRSIPYMDNNVIRDGRIIYYVCSGEFKPFKFHPRGDIHQCGHISSMWTPFASAMSSMNYFIHIISHPFDNLSSKPFLCPRVLDAREATSPRPHLRSQMRFQDLKMW
jgi:hypothetical protein